MDTRDCGWAILGTGGVSSRFAADLARAGPGARVVAVASRDRHNAEAFARHHGGQPTDYASAVTMPGVEAVYIATPPSLHEEHALSAIAAGRAVLVEKPFAQDAATAVRIIQAARAAGVFCMEAMWTRFLPMASALRQQVGSLGEPRALQAAFMGSSLPDRSSSLFDRARGGGALRHRGIYALSLAWMLLGPARVASAAARLGSSGVDEECTVVLRHSSGALSTCMASIRAPGPSHLIVSGTLGMIEVEAPLYRPFRARWSRTTPRPGGTNAGDRLVGLRDHPALHWLRQRLPAPSRGKPMFKPYSGLGYHYEAAEVASGIARGRLESAVMPLEQTIEVLRLMDAARSMFDDVEAS